MQSNIFNVLEFEISPSTTILVSSSSLLFLVIRSAYLRASRLIISFSLYKMNGDESSIIFGMLAGLMNALYWITLFRYSINKPFIKEHNFSKFLTYIFNYMDNRLLVDWFDLKYFIFPILFLFNILDYFIIILFIVNILLFIIYTLQRLYKGYYLLNVYKKSVSFKP